MPFEESIPMNVQLFDAIKAHFDALKAAGHGSDFGILGLPGYEHILGFTARLDPASEDELTTYLDKEFGLEAKMGIRMGNGETVITINLDGQKDLAKSLQTMRDKTQALQIKALDQYVRTIPASIETILGTDKPDRIAREALSNKLRELADHIANEECVLRSEKPGNETVMRLYEKSLEENVSAYKGQ